MLHDVCSEGTTTLLSSCLEAKLHAHNCTPISTDVSSSTNNYQKMGDITTYNGSALVAMRGKDCVAIAADKRLGMSLSTVSMGRENRIFQLSPHTLVGLSGLQSDVLTVSKKLRYRSNLYHLEESRDIRPKAMTKLLSHMLYENRFGSFFVSPVVCGIQQDGTPYVSTMDSIGATSDFDDFYVAGTAEQFLLGPCESYFKKNMTADELLLTLKKVIVAGINRDSLSGWGGQVVLLRADGTVLREDFATRVD